MAYGGRAQKFVYRHLPQGLRSLAATYYALRTYPTRHGPYFHEHLAHLKQNERLPDEELEKIQLRKLKALVAYAAERVPYYRSLFRERGIAPADIASLADLRRIPLLDKEAVRVNQSGLIAEGVRRGDLLCIHTSGTTGTPLDLYQTREFFQKEYAFWWFHRSWAGIHLGDRTATLAGHPVAPVDQEKPPFWIRNYHTCTGASLQGLWPEGKDVTVIEFTGPRKLAIGTGRVRSNIAQPPSGCCRTAVEIELYGVTDSRDQVDSRTAKGFHQIFVLGNHGRTLKAWCQLAGVAVEPLCA